MLRDLDRLLDDPEAFDVFDARERLDARLLFDERDPLRLRELRFDPLPERERDRDFEFLSEPDLLLLRLRDLFWNSYKIRDLKFK